MKTNFAKKIVKILTVMIFSVFVLTLFNSATVKAETKITTEETEEGGMRTTITEITYENRKDKTSGFGAGYITTREESKSCFNYGTQYEECNVDKSIKETYTDENGKDYEHSGNQTTDEDGNKVDVITSGEGNVNEVGNFEGSTYSASSKGKYIYTLLQPLPSADGPLTKGVTIERYLTWAFRFTLALAGFLAVMMIVIGGVEYIISGANEGMRSEAHKRISNAIYGLILALVSYLVLYTINPNLVDFKNNSFFNKETTSTEE